MFIYNRSGVARCGESVRRTRVVERTREQRARHPRGVGTSGARNTHLSSPKRTGLLRSLLSRCSAAVSQSCGVWAAGEMSGGEERGDPAERNCGGFIEKSIPLRTICGGTNKSGTDQHQMLRAEA